MSYLLTELDGRLLKITDKELHFETCETIAEADGMMLLCPKCFKENGGSKGTHSVLLWFSKCPIAKKLQGHEGWHASGTDISDITFTGPGAASVLLKHPGCGWHGFIKDGKATLS